MKINNLSKILQIFEITEKRIHINQKNDKFSIINKRIIYRNL